MGRRLFSARPIGFGNRVSMDGGNKEHVNILEIPTSNASQGGTGSRMCKRSAAVQLHRGPAHLHQSKTHALRCIDKVGGIDEYLLKTPYQKMDMEFGLYWKTKIEKIFIKKKKIEKM